MQRLDYVRIAHSHASVASRVADLVLVLDAVNANETVVRVGVVFIQAITPKAPRRDQILRRSKRIHRQ